MKKSKDKLPETLPELPFFNEIDKDWEEYRKHKQHEFKNNSAEGIAFMSFATGWLYGKLKHKMVKQ